MGNSLNPSKLELAKPIHSTENIPSDIGLITLGVILIIFIYVLIRVKLILNKDPYYKWTRKKPKGL
jgi:hypothetical protein